MDTNQEGERKLRVVMLVDGLRLAGGAETLARELVIRLDRERFERTLCVSRWSAPPPSDPDDRKELARPGRAGVRVLQLRRRSPGQIWAWWPLLSLLRRERIDVLHAHKFGSNVWAAVLGTLARTPVIIAHEHSWSFAGPQPGRTAKPLRRFLDRNLLGRTVDALLTVSRADRRRLIELEGVDPGKVVLVPNGIPTPPPPSGRDVRDELGIAPDAPVIGTVGGLRPEKALHVLIRAAALLRDRFPALKVLIAGPGSERSRLEGLIEELELQETVALLGYRSDVPDLLSAFQVAVCCSDYEGSPLSLMEYMEAALPVVATRVGGIPELIEHGVNGLLVEPQDPQGLAAAVEELLTDRSRATRMGRQGQARRRAEFDIELMVQRVERLYEELRATGTGRHSATG